MTDLRRSVVHPNKNKNDQRVFISRVLVGAVEGGGRDGIPSTASSAVDGDDDDDEGAINGGWLRDFWVVGGRGVEVMLRAEAELLDSVSVERTPCF